MEATNTSSLQVVQPKLIVDRQLPVNLQLVEADSGGRVVVKGEFARAGVATENKRVYPQKIWEKELGRLDKHLEKRKVFGELDHPPDGRTQLARVSHVVTNLRLDNGLIVGEAEVLDTEKGRDLKALLKAGCLVGVSSRGYGSTRTNEKGEEVIQDDYRLVTFDFVAEPADTHAYPEAVFEGVEIPKNVEADSLKEEKTAGKPETFVKISAEDREKLSQKIISEIENTRSILREQIKAELLTDPSVAASKVALDGILSLLRPLVIPESVENLLKKKEEEIAQLRSSLETLTVEVEEKGADNQILISRVTELKENCDLRLRDIKTDCDKRVEEEKKNSEVRLEEARAEYEAKLVEYKEGQVEQRSFDQHDYEKKLVEYKALYEVQVGQIRDEYNERLLQVRKEMEVRVKDLSDGYESKLITLSEIHQSKLQEADEESGFRIQELESELVGRDEKIKDLEESLERMLLVAKEAGYRYQLERLISNDLDAEVTRKLVGDVKKYASIDALTETVQSVQEDNRRKRELVKKAEEGRVEDLELSLAQEKKLKDQLDTMAEDLDRVRQDNEELRLRLHAEKKLAHNPRAGKIRSLVESARPSSKEEVDSLIRQFKDQERPSEDMDVVRSRVRNLTKGGIGSTPLAEERRVEGNGIDYNGLGVPLNELRALAGIGKDKPRLG